MNIHVCAWICKRSSSNSDTFSVLFMTKINIWCSQKQGRIESFLFQFTELILKGLNSTVVSFRMRCAYHPLQQIIGIKRDSASCASIHYMIFAYCVTLHYFQISFKIKICKLVTTSCLTPSQPVMVISACDSFSFVTPVMCFIFIC